MPSVGVVPVRNPKVATPKGLPSPAKSPNEMPLARPRGGEAVVTAGGPAAEGAPAPAGAAIVVFEAGGWDFPFVPGALSDFATNVIDARRTRIDPSVIQAHHAR